MTGKSILTVFVGVALLSWAQAARAQAPVITQITPDFAPVGGTVTIVGSGFGPSQGTSSVTFNGVPVTNVFSWGDPTVEVTVPAGAANGNIVVTVEGIPSNSINFIVTDPIDLFLSSVASTTSGLDQLSTARPSTATLTSPDLASQPAGNYLIEAFDTQAGGPGASTTWFAGVDAAVYLWMKQVSGAPGTLFPEVKVYLNGPSGTPVCNSVGTTALTATNTQYILGCTPNADVAVGPTDRYTLWVGVNSTAVSTGSLQAQLGVGPQFRGRAISMIVVPFH